MPIKKRKTIPTGEDAVTTASSPDEDFKTQGRSPLLQGLRYDVYMFIGQNPNCTRADVARGLSMPNNVATARVKELIDEGFVYEPLGIRKMNPSGVNAKVLHVTDQKAGAKPLDRVRVEVELAIDYNGHYYVHHAHVVGGTTKPKGYRLVKRQRFTMVAPRVGKPTKPMYILDDDARVERVSRADLWDAGEIIEGHVISSED